MPKVKLLHGMAGAVSGHHNPKAGDVLEVSKRAADHLVSRGHAERVASPVKKTAKKTAVKKTAEAATRAAPEAAMQPKAEPRDS